MNKEKLWAGFVVSIIFILAMIGLYFVQTVDAQIDVESKLQELVEDEGVYCDIWQIRDFMYQPVEIDIRYDNTTDTIVRLATTDSGSEPDYRGDEDNFFFNSQNFTDIYTIELLLDYSDKPQHQRDVTYEIHTDGGQLTHDGIWNFNATQFCKVFVFDTDLKPKFPTPEETAKSLEDKTVSILEIQNKSIENVENSQFWVIVIIFGVAGTVILSGIIYADNLRSVKNSVKKPMEAYGKLETKNNRIIKNNQILADYVINVIDDIRKIGGRIDNALGDMKFFYTDMGLAKKQNLDSQPEVKQEENTEEANEKTEEEKGSFIKKFSKITDIIKKHKDDKTPTTELGWSEVFIKQSREENEELHEQLTQQYSTEPTNQLAVQLTALRKVLFKQV